MTALVPNILPANESVGAEGGVDLFSGVHSGTNRVRDFTSHLSAPATYGNCALIVSAENLLNSMNRSGKSKNFIGGSPYAKMRV